MFYLRKLSIFSACQTLFSSRLNSIDIRRLVSFHSCLDLRDSGVLNRNTSCYNLRGAEIFLQFPKVIPRLCHDSALSPKTAQVSSKLEKSRFEEIQVVAADGSTVNKMKRAQAEQIARDKNLKLVLVNKGDESQPVSLYRLMTSAEYRTQMKELKQVKRLEKLPDLKTLKLNSSIAERDLQIKVSQIVEWIQAGHSVKVAIMSSRKSTVQDDDSVFNKILSASKEIATVKQATKTSTQLLFHLVPRMVSSNPDCTERSTDDDRHQRPLKTEELKRLKADLNKQDKKVLSNVGASEQ